MWNILNFQSLITVAKHMPRSLHFILEVRKLTCVRILYTYVVYGFYIYQGRMLS